MWLRAREGEGGVLKGIQPSSERICLRVAGKRLGLQGRQQETPVIPDDPDAPDADDALQGIALYGWRRVRRVRRVVWGFLV